MDGLPIREADMAREEELAVRGLRLCPVCESSEEDRIARSGAIRLGPRSGEAALAHGRRTGERPGCAVAGAAAPRTVLGACWVAAPVSSAWLQEPPGSTEVARLRSPHKSRVQRIRPEKKEL
ncbi:hypothetical protein NDU88_006397 [Pleurodeles waltl]|uniref:Uncharacterized protein n=1 Tax=Pleurodeles waltl TaxID=8319 RepID=A0AAV7QL79_PLEWA|nr:hypothetical protein NDU88_006397 [Pleurodeles waltl]